MSWILNTLVNQKGSPAIYTDTLANRPAFGYTGRLFVASDTFAWYRDTGSGWDLIGGPGSGTITGTLTGGQVAYATGSNTIATSANLLFNGTRLTAQEFTSNTDVTINGVKFGAGGGNKNTNIAAGSGALNNANTAAPGFSVAIGYNALLSATSPDYALAIGARAMEKTLTSSANGSVAVGPLALFENLTGGSNTAIGYGSMNYNTTGNLNVSIGYLSQENSATGSNNTSLGARSLANVSAGSNNVAIGFSAGSSTSEGGSNFNSIQSVYIGASSRSLAPGAFTNEIVIGYNTTGSGSNTVTIGNSSITNTYLKGVISGTSLSMSGGGSFGANSLIGAGTASGSYRLALNGDGSAGVVGGIVLRNNATDVLYIGNISAADNTNIEVFNPRNGYLRFATNNLERLRISSGGNVLIGTTVDDLTNKLQVNGSGAFIGNLKTAGELILKNGGRLVSNTDAATSDAYYRITNTNGDYNIGADNSTGSSFGFGAYGFGVYMPASTNYIISKAGTEVFKINTSNAASFVSSIQTGAPSGGTAAAWKMGIYNAVVTASTGYIELDVNGTLYKLLAST